MLAKNSDRTYVGPRAMGTKDAITWAREEREVALVNARSARRSEAEPLDVLLGHMESHPRVCAAAFLVVEPGRGRVETATGWFESPALRDGLEAALDRPFGHSRSGLLEATLESDAPLYVGHLESWEGGAEIREHVHAGVPSSRAAQAWEALRHASVIGCVVRTSANERMGVLLVTSSAPESPLLRSDVATVKVLADLAGLAKERSELLTAEAFRAQEELLLKRAAESTSGSLEMAEVQQRVVENALRLVDADYSLLSRVRPGTEVLTTGAHAGAAVNFEAAGVDGEVLAEVVRTRRPVTDSATTPCGHVPVELGPRLFGVLSVKRLHGKPFSGRDIELLGTLARMGAAAMANATDFERERRVARALTSAFVPSAPLDIPDYEVGLLYEPAEHQPAGGDLFGAWTLPGGDVAVVVGDVAGKGPETAALSAMARFFIEARSWDCSSPAEVLAQAATMLHDRLPRDTFVTAVFGVFSENTIRYANAGHLPAMVLSQRGEIREAPGHGLPLGIEESPSYREHELSLEPGDLVMGVTDGLPEARRQGELYGYERLKETVREAAGPGVSPQELLRTVYETVRAWADGNGLSDDAAALVLRRRPSGAT